LAALILRQTTGQPHLRDLAIVTGITLLSSQAAMIPIGLARKSDPVVVFQAAFGGSVIHLFTTLALGATVHAMKWVDDRSLFLFLLLGFYWFSLIFVVTAMIKIFRRSVPQPRAAGEVQAKGS
jgi:hypothetical protein